MELDIFQNEHLDQENQSFNNSKDESIQVEAIQICRNVKSVVSGKKREVIDTIVVSYPKMTYERALKIARHKAQMIKNCYIVEKCERVLEGY